MFQLRSAQRLGAGSYGEQSSQHTGLHPLEKTSAALRPSCTIERQAALDQLARTAVEIGNALERQSLLPRHTQTAALGRVFARQHFVRDYAERIQIVGRMGRALLRPGVRGVRFGIGTQRQRIEHIKRLIAVWYRADQSETHYLWRAICS